MSDNIGLIGEIVGIVGGLAGIGSAIIAWIEWRKVNRKIAMLEDAGAAFEVVPTWYTSRMMGDHWLFGLQMANGQMLVINRINAVSSDGVWMDVTMATGDEVENVAPRYKPLTIAVADDRRDASVRIDRVQAAIDLQTS